MKRLMCKILTILFLTIIIISLFINIALGWSWRDLKLGVTTEEELIKFGGMPRQVQLDTPDYFELKKGKPYNVKFEYEDSEIEREMVRMSESKGKPVWYDPAKIPVLATAPLQLSNEIIIIKMSASFSQRLYFFLYEFYFSSEINKSKYIEIFNSILGKPIQITDFPTSKDSIYITYVGGYSVSIDPYQRLIKLYGFEGQDKNSKWKLTIEK